MFPGLNNQCSVTEDITIDCVLYLLWQSERTMQLISLPSGLEVGRARAPQSRVTNRYSVQIFCSLRRLCSKVSSPEAGSSARRLP